MRTGKLLFRKAKSRVMIRYLRNLLGDLGFQFHPALGDGVAHLDVVARDQSDGQVFREVEALVGVPTLVFVRSRKFGSVETQRVQHVADVYHHMVMALTGQLGNLAAAHGQGGGGGIC